MDTNEVSIAFEIPLEELEPVVNGLNVDGAQAFEAGNYDRAKQLIEHAIRLTGYPPSGGAHMRANRLTPPSNSCRERSRSYRFR